MASSGEAEASTLSFISESPWTSMITLPFSSRAKSAVADGGSSVISILTTCNTAAAAHPQGPQAIRTVVAAVTAAPLTSPMASCAPMARIDMTGTLPATLPRPPMALIPSTTPATAL